VKRYQERLRTLDQRVEHVRRWLSELECWTYREAVPLSEWRFSAPGTGIADRVLRRGDPWPSRDGVTEWTYGTVELPESWSPEETRLVLDLGGEARVFLDYGARMRSCASNPYHRALFVEGRSFSLRAEAVARDLFGRPRREPKLAAAFLGLREEELAAFLREAAAILDGALALRDHDAAPALLELIELELARLPWPTETVPFLERIADHPETLSIWDRLVEPPASPRPLGAEHRTALSAAAERLRAGLAELRGRWPKTGKVALTGHAHIDYVWLWPQEETVRKALRTFGTQVQLMDRYPSFRFNQSQACLYADVEAADPDLFGELRRQVREGRWEPVGGMWVESDTNMPSAEGFNRQFLYGQSYFRSRFGLACRTVWLPDTFGFSAVLPQLFLAAGLDSMLTIKVAWNEKNPLPDNIFRWQGLDGSRVLVHTFEAGAFGGYNMELSPRAVQDVWRNLKNKTLHDETLASYGYGDGGGGPTPEQIESIEAINRLPAVPTVESVLVRDFFGRLRASLEDADAPVWNGELYLEYHRATLTTQGRTKALMRAAQSSLAAAEFLEGLLWLSGVPQDGDYGTAWKLLLRNQFHDALPGSSIREVYERTEAELDSVLSLAEASCAAALDRLAARLAPGTEAGLFLANLSGAASPNLKAALPADAAEYGRALGAQRGSDGAWLLSAPLAMPAAGLRFAAALPAPGPLRAEASHLENRFISVDLDENGRLASVYDKVRGREVLSGPGNQIWAYKDRPRTYDAWDIESNFELGGAELRDADSVQLTETGPHRAEITVVRPFGERSRLVQRYRLWADSPRLDIRTTVELGDRRIYLRARFPLAVHSDYASFDQALGVVRRPTHDNTSWQRAQFESSAHRFVDLSETGFGVALLNDGKYGHSAKDGVLTVSLVRGPTYPDPFADEGVQSFTYSLLPHGGAWWAEEVQAEADCLAGALRVRPCAGSETGAAPLSWSGVPLRLLAFKRAEDGRGRILRVAEEAGSRGRLSLSLPAGFSVREETNTLEDPVGAPDYVFTPFKMRSYRIGESPGPAGTPDCGSSDTGGGAQ
jgi:alpha-mannosidase